MGVGYYQSEIRDLRGNALVNAVVDVFSAGTTTPATLFSNAAGTTPLTASPLAAAAGLVRPGKDEAGNVAFFASDEVEYDVRVTDPSGTFTFRARLDPGPIASGTYVPADPVIAVTYYADGTVASSTEAGITTTFTYNADGTVATSTRLGVTRTYTYVAGNLTSVA